MVAAIKSLFIYVYIIVLLRVLGKKEASQLSIYDLVVFLLISDLMVVGFDEHLFDSIIATLVLVFTDYLSSYISLKSKKVRDIIEGCPSFIVYNGKLNIEAMRKCKYTCDSLAQHLRQNGVSSLSEVAYAVLETSGELSIIKHKDNQVKILEPIIMDGIIQKDVLKKNGIDEQWVIHQLKGNKVSEIMYAIVEKERLFFVEK